MNNPAPLQPLSPGAAGRSAAWRPGRVWDQVSIYLPVLLMGLMALGSYWLLRATPEATLPAALRDKLPSIEAIERELGLDGFEADSPA